MRVLADPMQVTRRHFEICAPIDNQDLALKPDDCNPSWLFQRLTVQSMQVLICSFEELVERTSCLDEVAPASLNWNGTSTT